MPRKQSFKTSRKFLFRQKKAIYKNHLRFVRCLCNPNFAKDFNELQDKYGINKTLTSKVIFARMNDFNPGIFYNQAVDNLKDLNITDEIYNLGVTKTKQVFNDVEKFVYQYQLGKEWSDSINILLATGEFQVPVMNFYFIFKDEPKTMGIEFNSTTTLEDIAMCFDSLKQTQKELWFGSKRENFTKNAFSNFKNFNNRDSEKKNLADVKNFDSLESTYESAILKGKESMKEKIKLINKYRKTQKGKPISLKKKVSDVEFAKKLLTEEGIKKPTKDIINRRVNQIRKSASRQKMKIS